MAEKRYGSYWMFAGLFVLLLVLGGCNHALMAKFAIEDNRFNEIKTIYKEHPELPKDCLEYGYNNQQQYCPLDEEINHVGCNSEKIIKLIKMGFQPSKKYTWADYIERSIQKGCEKLTLYLIENMLSHYVATASMKVTIQKLQKSEPYDRVATSFQSYQPSHKPVGIRYYVSEESEFRLEPNDRKIYDALYDKNKKYCDKGIDQACKALAHLDDEKNKISTWYAEIQEKQRVREEHEALKQQEKDLAKLFPATEDGMKYCACLCVEAEKQWKQEIEYQNKIEKESGVANKLILYKAGKNIVQIKEALKEFKKQYGKLHKKSLGLNGCQKHIETVQRELPESIYSAAHFCEFP